jgi:hypothetical protein
MMEASHVQPRAYEEIIEFLAAGSSPEDILQFRPSAKALRRVRSLLEKNRNGTLSSEEEAELAQYEHIEHLMRLVKARARQFVKSQFQKPSGEVIS